MTNNPKPSLDTLEAPDLEVFATMIAADDIVNFHGEAVDMPRVIREYGRDLALVIDCLKGRRAWPSGFRFFVPDLWHEAFGRARSFPKEEGELLWAACRLGTELGRSYLTDERYGVRRHLCGGKDYGPPAAQAANEGEG
jgi:hypothetical protein